MCKQRPNKTVKFLSVAARGRYQKGQIIELSAIEADHWIKYGCAREIEPEIDEKVQKSPENKAQKPAENKKA
jgi:hypothetical protein